MRAVPTVGERRCARSPVPHARSSTSDPVGSPSSATRVRAPAAIEPERDHAVHAVVLRRDAVEHPLDRCGASRHLRAANRRVGSAAITIGSFPAGLVARRGELGRVADRFEMLLRDLEQHAAEVVRDECGDGGEQRAERLDETLRLLVVGQVGRAAADDARARRTSRPRRRRSRGSPRGGAARARAGR